MGFQDLGNVVLCDVGGLEPDLSMGHDPSSIMAILSHLVFTFYGF